MEIYLKSKIRKSVYCILKIPKIVKFLRLYGIRALLSPRDFIRLMNRHYSHTLVHKYLYIEPELAEEIEAEVENFHKKPLISIIVPVYNVDPRWLALAVQSVRNQWYKNWELCIADDCSTNDRTVAFLKSIEADPKIKIKYLKKNLNIAGASNGALKLAKGEYVGLLDNDDELAPDALFEVVNAINKTGAEFIYSDEDNMQMEGKFIQPHFKADYSPDMFLSQNYICHFAVIKKKIVDKVKGFTSGLDGAQDYDLFLKVLEHTEKIFHIQKILYHWRAIPGSTAEKFSEKSYAHDAGKRAIEKAVNRRELDAVVVNGKYPGTYRVKYNVRDNPLVSIIIPFKDKPKLLKMCVTSILNKSTYQNFEIVGVNNGSTKKKTFECMRTLAKKDDRIRFFDYDVPFNYSKINNYAVNNYAKGKHILLLNNDIEIITPSWLEAMLEFSQRKDVGAVGGKLYYPDNLVQHAGLVAGIGGTAGHSHKFIKRENPGYYHRNHIVHNVSAVTGACLMVKKKVYEGGGGLDEDNLKISFNDVDFCFRLREQGYLNVFTPYCEAYHHESVSRGYEVTTAKKTRAAAEALYLQERHSEMLQAGDPYYNPNLTLDREDFTLKGRVFNCD